MTAGLSFMNFVGSLLSLSNESRDARDEDNMTKGILVGWLVVVVLGRSQSGRGRWSVHLNEFICICTPSVTNGSAVGNSSWQ